MWYLYQNTVKKVSITNIALRIEQGQNIKYIQNKLGHASIQTTLDREIWTSDYDVNTGQAKKLDSILGVDREADLDATLSSNSAVFLNDQILMIYNTDWKITVVIENFQLQTE